MEKQLPKNWVQTSPLMISKIIRGVSYGKTDASQVEFDNSCLILRGGNIQDGEIVDGKDNVYVPLDLIKKEQFIQEHDVVIVGSTGSKNLIGKAATSLHNSDKISFGAFLMLIRAFEPIDKRYFSYYFQTNYYREAIRNLAGGVNINNIRKEYIENLYFPLPPLAEQNRIVAKLDTLFTQLENIKASMAKIPVLLKEFRQQVLTQAVTGKLTEEWRKGKKVVEWKKEKLSSIADIIDPHPSHRTPPEVENGIPYISIGDIDKSSKIDFFNSRKVSPTILDEHLKRYQLKDGDFIFGKIGTIGKPIIIPSVQDYTLSANVILIQPKKEIVHPKFIFFYMDSTVLMKLIMADTKSTSQPAYGIKKMREQIIPFPIIEEQQEIVSRVESLFAKADAIEQQYQLVKEKIDNLPQALLHKAFKGELTEQLESDGDARELLKQIQELKNNTVKPKKATSKKVKKYPENETVLGMVAEE